MFWKYNNNSSAEIDALLGKEEVTILELMDAEDIISQCKAQSKALIDFLLRPKMIEELVTLITEEPSPDIDEKVRFKYPNIACELLTCDIPAINERLASDEVLLNKLYSFMECEPPLNPLLASYVSRIMGALIAKKTEQVLDYLKAKDTFISLLLKHLGTSAIMDLMLKLMTQVECIEMKQNILNWLDSQRIMQSLVCLLNPKVDKERHHNVAQLLCDFIRTARDIQKNSSERVDPDPLLNTLESAETISLLLENIFDGEKTESCIVGGIQVLLALLDVNQISIPKLNSLNTYNSNINDEAIDIEHKERVVKSTTDSLVPHLKHFHDLLLNPPKKPMLRTTVGVLETPLGNTRLQVTKLLGATIASDNARVSQEIVSLGTFSVLIDLFFKYPWNNFLHTQVENCLISAIKTQGTEESDEILNALNRHIVVDCNLIERILKAWKDNDEQQKETNGLRQGYMGHLISIINKIVELCSNSCLGKYIADNIPELAKTLDEFKETTLKETNTVQNSFLGGAYPNSSNEENEDFGEITFNPEQVQFSSYQARHLIPLPIDGYSDFNDDAFNEMDDTLQNFDHRDGLLFNVSPSDIAQQLECFKQVCIQNINTLDDLDDQAFEDKDNTFRTVIEKEDRNETQYSSDSDDDSPSVGVPMEVDPWQSPKPPESGGAAADAADPWGTAPAPAQSNAVGDAWADFGSVKFEAAFDEATSDQKKEERGEQGEQSGQKRGTEEEKKVGADEGGQAAAAEPSNAPSLVEGDSCSVKSQEASAKDTKDV